MIATESFSRKTATKMTLEEIARLVGFSRSTVSRVINDDPNVSAETRERVWRVTKAHDFHLNPAARTLAGRRSQVIGLMIPQALTTIFTDPYFPMLIQGSAAACDARGYFLMLSLALGQPDDTFRWLLRSRHIDGVIVVAALAGDAFVTRLLDEHFPFVRVGRNSERGAQITIALVGFDDMPLAAAVEPSLTTVRQPISQLEFLAASTLIDLLEAAPIETEGNGARHIALPTEQVVRASCGYTLRCTTGAHAPAQLYF